MCHIENSQIGDGVVVSAIHMYVIKVSPDAQVKK